MKLEMLGSNREQNKNMKKWKGHEIKKKKKKERSVPGSLVRCLDFQHRKDGFVVYTMTETAYLQLIKVKFSSLFFFFQSFDGNYISKRDPISDMGASPFSMRR